MFTKTQTKKTTDGDEWGNQWQADFEGFSITVEQILDQVEVTPSGRAISHFVTTEYEVQFWGAAINGTTPEDFSVQVFRFTSAAKAKSFAMTHAVEQLRKWLESKLPAADSWGQRQQILDALVAINKGCK